MADSRRGQEMIGLMRQLAAADGRQVPVEGTLNFRDVGGYPVSDGGAIAWRTLFRSDGLYRVDAAGAATIDGLGLNTVIDLRIAAEREVAPSPIDALSAKRPRTLAYSLVGEDFSELPADLGGVYSYLVSKRGPAIGSVLKQLASPGALPALVHCTAGKDRTGIVVAFTLAAVGVPDEVIAADYALSSVYLVPGQTAVIGQISAAMGLDEQLTDELMASPPELIVRALDQARQQYGSVVEYLVRNGVTPAELAALKAALIAPE